MKSKNEMKLVIDGKEIDLGKFFEQEAGEEAHEGTGAITESGNDSVDKRKLIDEVGGILKGKVDEELWRTVIGKLKKLAYDGSETSESDNEEPEKPEDPAMENEDGGALKGGEHACKAANSFEKIYTKLSNAWAKKEKDRNAGLKRAYIAASAVIGEFNPFGLTEREMLVKALNHQGIDTDKESVPELYAMLKVCNSQTKVDNGFDYGTGGSDEIEINI